MCRDEEGQGTSVSKEANLVDGGDNSIHLNQHELKLYITFQADSHGFALERSPNYSAISNGKLGQTTTWEDTTLGDIEGIHDCDNEVSTSASSLNILQEPGCDQLVHIATKVRGMQSDLTLEVV
jgi:hypothetical protein